MKKRFLTMLMAVIMLITVSLPSVVSAVADDAITADEICTSREKLAEMLNIPAEDLDNVTFYTMAYNPGTPEISPLAITIPSDGSSVTVDTGWVNGGATAYGNQFTITGDRFVWAMSVTGLTNTSVSIMGSLYALGGAGLQKTLYVGEDQTVNSGFMNATRNTTFQIQYYCPSGVKGVVISIVACYNSSR